MFTMSTSESRYHHGDLRAALIAAALARLAEGETDVSLRDIARDAGVSATAAYRHFSSKDALLASVADEGFRILDATRTDMPLPPAERLMASLSGYVAFAGANPHLYALMFGTLHSPGDALPNRAASFLHLKGLVCAVTGEDAASDASDADAARIWAAAHGCASLVLAGLIGPERQAQGLVEAILAPLASNPKCLRD